MKSLITVLIFLLTSILFSQNTEVYLFDISNINGKLSLINKRNISNNDGYDNQPSFYKDNQLAFVSTRNKQTDIATYNIRNKKVFFINSTPNGGEYSPLKIPNTDAISAVRLDDDGKQRLYQYNFRTGQQSEIIENLVVAYYTWYDENTIVSAVIENDNLNLYVSDLLTNTNIKYSENVGRSFHKIPNSNLISFIAKAEDKWTVKSLNPTNGEIKVIIDLPSKVEDICWLINGNILITMDNTIYQFNPKKDKKLKVFTSFKDENLQKITRISTNEIGTMLALVSESPTKTKTLEPKLKNIAWISGTWHGEGFGDKTEEIWSKPSAGSMMATFKLINDGKVTFYEIKIIREIENSLILQLKHFGNDLKGWETKDETVDFPLKEITEDKVVFEGMTFERVSENEMNVYVDITEKDKTETVKFNYKKQ